MNKNCDIKIKRKQDANKMERELLHSRFAKDKKFKIDDGDPLSINDMDNKTLTTFYRVLLKEGQAKSQVGLVVFEEIKKRNIRMRI